MAFSEFEIHRYSSIAETYIEGKRPPAHIRPELDLAFRLVDQSIELYEIRPYFKNPEEKIERPFARMTYVKTTDTWKLFWMMSDLKWHGYEPAPEHESLEDAIAVVDADKFNCFFG